MTVDKYLFWSNIGLVVNNLDNLSIYREGKWVENLSFKENLDINIKTCDFLLENENKIDLKPIKPTTEEEIEAHQDELWEA